MKKPKKENRGENKITIILLITAVLELINAILNLVDKIGR